MNIYFLNSIHGPCSPTCFLVPFEIFFKHNEVNSYFKICAPWLWEIDQIRACSFGSSCHFAIHPSMIVTDKYSGTILPPDSACNYKVLWFTRKAEGSFGMTCFPQVCDGIGGGGVGTRPARTRLEIALLACAHLHTSWKKKRNTWEFLPVTAMRGIWERLAIQKLCLYSDR